MVDKDVLSVTLQARIDQVMADKIRAVCTVLDIREAELLELKGPCSNSNCPLHLAHRGPCGLKKELLADTGTEL